MYKSPAKNLIPPAMKLLKGVIHIIQASNKPQIDRGFMTE